MPDINVLHAASSMQHCSGGYVLQPDMKTNVLNNQQRINTRRWARNTTRRMLHATNNLALLKLAVQLVVAMALGILLLYNWPAAAGSHTSASATA